MLTIRIENIDFDTQACVLRLKGRNIAENQYVKVKILIYIYIYMGNVAGQSLSLKYKSHFMSHVLDGCISHLGPGSES